MRSTNSRSDPDAVGDDGEGEHDAEDDGGDDEDDLGGPHEGVVVAARALTGVREAALLVQDQSEPGQAHRDVVVVGQVFPGKWQTM